MARYIKTEDATPYLTKYIPSVEAVERSKVDKAIEEIENRSFDNEPFIVGMCLDTYRKEVLEILKRNIGE